MKKEMKALIDGDVLVYWSANWGQANYFDVINSGGEVLDSRESKRFAQDSADDLMDFGNEELTVEAEVTVRHSLRAYGIKRYVAITK